VTWGDSDTDDGKRWVLCVTDTGPGLNSDSAKPLARAVESDAGEGIGLSIVKRLCELLDATIELKSVKDVGTTFRILFPRKYTN